MSQDVLSLVAARRGHFRLESGHHSGLWLDLDKLFTEPRRISPFVTELARAIRPHDVAGVCGPLVGGAFLAQMLASTLDIEFFYTEREMPPDREGLYLARYHLPGGARARVRGKRLAIVDDAISAGSAVRGTFAELEAHGAEPAVVGTLILLGSAAAPYFAERGVALEAIARVPFELWPPPDCRLCASGAPLEDPAAMA
ncbi:MAG TPA: phosphoribosyltransferase family protein [Gemmatimonadales bacterium]|nr:phosphoribosyltransferase family protein [Gemmatimonadales bacterium]